MAKVFSPEDFILHERGCLRITAGWYAECSLIRVGTARCATCEARARRPRRQGRGNERWISLSRVNGMATGAGRQALEKRVRAMTRKKRIRSEVARRVIEFGRSCGYEITPSWRLESRPLVVHLRALFRRYSVDCVFDVGANLGQYHDLIRDEVGFAGPIVSFEPVTYYAARLKTLATGDKRWSVFDF